MKRLVETAFKGMLGVAIIALIGGTGTVMSGYASGPVKAETLIALRDIAVPNAPASLAIGSRLEPLIDDYLIAQMSGDVRQKLYKPTPREVVFVADKLWEGDLTNYFSVFKDGNIYRMYYRAARLNVDAAVPGSKHAEYACYAESTDGIHWTRPNLGILGFQGSTSNNIILPVDAFVAFKDNNPDCPTDSKYKGVSREGSLYLYKSADGIHWTKTGVKITGGAFDSQNVAFWDPVTERYVITCRGKLYGSVRTIATCFSTDYINWSPLVYITYPGSPKMQMYTSAVNCYPGAEHIQIGFPTQLLPGRAEKTQPLFMSSRDGLHFNRWADPVIAITDPEDRAAHKSNYMAYGVLALPGNAREWSVYATEGARMGSTTGTRLRRFTYRVDGFVSIRADNAGGDVLTKPLTFSGKTLKLNFATQTGGQIHVRLESSSGVMLAQSAALTGDEIAYPVRWQGMADLSALQGQTVQLRFSMKNADLYSIQFGPATSK